METELDRTERRIIGVMIEKEATTPDRYPLTVNALVAGCNQRNNRDPVMTLTDFEVEGALRNLFVRGWVHEFRDGGRMIKWKHGVREKLGIDEAGAAVLAELLLRGPQQPGALRTRADRMARLPTLGDLMEVLEALAERMPPLVKNLGRGPGERAARWGQTLAADDDVEASAPPPAPTREPAAVSASPPAASSTSGSEDQDALRRLEERVAALEDTVTRLRERLGDL